MESAAGTLTAPWLFDYLHATLRPSAVAPSTGREGDPNVTAHDTICRLDDLIQSRSILRHPFYVAWQQGTLTREQLATYARVYFPHVAAFPRYLASTAAGTTDPSVRGALERNLADELHHPKAHQELWLDFASGLGADRESVEGAAPHAAAAAVVASFDRLTRSDAASGLAALYAYESQQPDVSRQKADGLRHQYGVTEPRALAYFEVHAETDLEHRAEERAALERCLAAGASGEAVLAAAGEALDAYWALLDGVCDEAGIACTAP
jgi:pyrroloquinoline-quinone synthase